MHGRLRRAVLARRGAFGVGPLRRRLRQCDLRQHPAGWLARRPPRLPGRPRGAGAGAQAPQAERRAEVVRVFGRLFGATRADASRTTSSGTGPPSAGRAGCYSGAFGPSGWTDFGPALREPVGRIHWAGTETATVWNGYIDGAITSGERAAAEVARYLGSAVRQASRPRRPDRPGASRACGTSGVGLEDLGLLGVFLEDLVSSDSTSNIAVSSESSLFGRFSPTQARPSRSRLSVGLTARRASVFRRSRTGALALRDRPGSIARVRRAQVLDRFHQLLGKARRVRCDLVAAVDQARDRQVELRACARSRRR